MSIVQLVRFGYECCRDSWCAKCIEYQISQVNTYEECVPYCTIFLS